MDVRLAEHGAQLAADDFVSERDGYLSPSEASAVYGMLTDFVIPSSYLYLPCATLSDQASLARFLPQPLAAFVLAHLARLLALAPDEVRARTQGFEVWTTRVGVRPDGQIYLHIDCDEELRKSAGKLRTPLMGSVLYLGPSTGLAGGETAYVLDERPHARLARFQFHDWRALAALDGVRTVEPRVGRLALFAGHLPHGQAPVVSHPVGAPRIALLANLAGTNEMTFYYP